MGAYVGGPKIFGDAEAPLPLDRGVDDLETRYSPMCFVPNSVALVKRYGRRLGSQDFLDAGVRPLATCSNTLLPHMFPHQILSV